MSLTDTALKALNPPGTPSYIVSDDRGLYVEVQTTWRCLV